MEMINAKDHTGLVQIYSIEEFKSCDPAKSEIRVRTWTGAEFIPLAVFQGRERRGAFNSFKASHTEWKKSSVQNEETMERIGVSVILGIYIPESEWKGNS